MRRPSIKTNSPKKQYNNNSESNDNFEMKDKLNINQENTFK